MTVPSPVLRNRLPEWLRQELPSESELEKARRLSLSGINTVCVKAQCPNWTSCFKYNRLTFMILGDKCTRSCRFCAVEKSATPKLSLDEKEPLRVAEAIKNSGSRYAVVTSVTRDDLPDGGAKVFARIIALIKSLEIQARIEVLIPDFRGSAESLGLLVEAAPDVIAHNMETVERLYKDLRPGSDYTLSLGVLSAVKRINPAMMTKSSLMLGLGETPVEVSAAMRDVRARGCDILVLGQYLAPSEAHYPVREFISPERFDGYKREALGLGFKAVIAAPLARSSYRAEETYNEAIKNA